MCSVVIYVLDLAEFDHSEAFFLPLIVFMIFTLIRVFRNVDEKRTILENLRNEKEDSIDQEKMHFKTCPEYWTKTTVDNQTLCRNKFTNKENEAHYIGGPLTKLSTPDSKLESTDVASNIGFEFDKVNLENGEETFERANDTYIPMMRSKKGVIEGFETDEGHDRVPHKHHRTYVDYAHVDKPVAWVDGVDREHDPRAYKDKNHLVIFNEEIYHDHSTNNVYDHKGNLIYGKAIGRINPGELEIQSVEEKELAEYGNSNNWISPHSAGNVLEAEINLTELNKSSNKCQLVKNFPWIEAKTKCANVNVKFE
jgi:hypothetical protein